MNKIENFWSWSHELSEQEFSSKFPEPWNKAVVDNLIPEDAKFGIQSPPQIGSLVIPGYENEDEEELEDLVINPKTLPMKPLPMMYSPEFNSLMVWVTIGNVGEWYMWEV